MRNYLVCVLIFVSLLVQGQTTLRDFAVDQTISKISISDSVFATLKIQNFTSEELRYYWYLKSMIYFDQFKNDSLRYSMKIIDSLINSDDGSEAIAFLHYVKGLYYKNRLAEFEKAQFHLERSYQLFESFDGTELLRLRVRTYKVYLLLEQLQYARAYTELMFIKEEYLKLKNHIGVLNTLNNLAILAMRLELNDDAESFLQMSLQLIEEKREEIPNEMKYVVYSSNAELKIDKNQLGVAKEQLDIARGFAITPFQYFYLDLTKCELYFKMGDYRELGALADNVLMGLDSVKASRNQKLSFFVYRILAILGQGNTDEAMSLMGEIYMEIFHSNIPFEHKESFFNHYAQILERKNQMIKALQVQKLYNQLVKTQNSDKERIEIQQQIFQSNLQKIEDEKGQLEEVLESEREYLIVLLISAFLVTLLTFALYRLNRTLRHNNGELSNRNKMIEEQQEELISANSQLSEFQKNLEITIEQRTGELYEKTEMLESYAFLNSHKIRAHVANILGLLNILEIEKDPEKRILYLGHIKTETEGLDEMCHQINESIDRGVPLDKLKMD